MTYDCMTIDPKGRTQEAKRLLQQVRLYDIHINSKLEELDKLKALTLKITTTIKPDVVSSGGNQDKIGDAVAKIVDLQDEINQAVDNYIDRKKLVSDIIEKIQDPDHVAILYKRYFNYERWEQIACEIGCTYRNVCYIHGKALLAFAELMKG